MSLRRTLGRRLLAAAAVALTVGALAAPAQAQFIEPPSPLVKQRADTAIYKHTDGFYYMTASVPDYKRVELRRASTLAGLGTATPTTIYQAPSSGPLSGWIWAPDVKFYDGAWYLYFSASPSSAVFDQRLYWTRTTSANPLTGSWSAPARFTTGWESFQLDPASFELGGQRYFTWAQDSPSTSYNSHMYIARMASPTSLATAATEIARPTYAWEMEGVAGVVEGPSPLLKNGRVYIAYSASATDSRYKLGLLSSWDTANLLDPASWYKHPTPVFQTANGVYGPGHGSFTVAEDNRTDLLVFHARDYANPTPDALKDPNRHTRVQQLYWRDNGDPFFGQPLPTGMTKPGIRGQHSNKCVDDWEWRTAPGSEVRLYTCTGSNAQAWEFSYVGGHYRIRNQHANLCLENWGSGTALDSDVRLGTCNGATAQDWTLLDRGNGWFSLRNRHSGLCLDNYARDTADGARISQYTCNGNAAQLWRRG
ncbi:family 43 glycosylhydrolase [Cellulomonas sp. NS3]|uniref:family 43 glycosylhydrolase n=1 Tax=Cellulomonas sp. NS3 TaxID=2973977 RepID=UPI0021613676|nr:family 43 glycosylhydrolase [Cellulomonas sp. NS3]